MVLNFDIIYHIINMFTFVFIQNLIKNNFYLVSYVKQVTKKIYEKLNSVKNLNA